MLKDEMKAITNLKMENTFYISQKMLHSLHILQMDTLSLEEYIAEQLMENPVLEYPKSCAKLPEGILWDRLTNAGTEQYDTLEFFLMDQLSRLKLPQRVEKLCRKLVSFIDQNGYLQEALMPGKLLQDASYFQTLQALQSLDPPGVGARDLRECLFLQLRRRESENLLEETLIQNHLEDISHRNFRKIQKATGAPMEDLEKAIGCLLSLNPRPGAVFDSSSQAAYLHPDFIISLKDGHVAIQQEERAFPTLNVSDYYVKLYRSEQDPEVKRYLKDRIRAAKQLVTGLENRKSTTLRCVEAILQIQQSFFLNPSRQLQPLTLETISRMLDLHISTVSRAISGKYLEFEGKLYPLKDFFTRSVPGTGGQVSTRQVKELIRKIVDHEDPMEPMSDQQIVQVLEQGGNMVSRRTVAKYREQMGIPASKQRRIL